MGQSTKKVYKYELDQTMVIAGGHELGHTLFEIPLPAHAEILTGGVHGGQVIPCIWALVDEDAKAVVCHHVIAIGTGVDFPIGENIDGDFGHPEYRFLGTFVYRGNEVLHLFEVE